MGAVHSLWCRAGCASPVSLHSVPRRGWLLSALGRQGRVWSPVSYFLVICSPSGDTRGPSVIFEVVNIPGSGTFHFSHIADYIYDFVLSLTHMLAFLSLYVMLSRPLLYTSFQLYTVLVWSMARYLHHMQ